MDSASSIGAEAPVRYLLSSRLSPEGQVSITLKLYRGNQIALTQPVAVVDLDQTADVMRKCRQRLNERGLKALTFDTFKARYTSISSAGVPPASRIFQKRR